VKLKLKGSQRKIFTVCPTLSNSHRSIKCRNGIAIETAATTATTWLTKGRLIKRVVGRLTQTSETSPPCPGSLRVGCGKGCYFSSYFEKEKENEAIPSHADMK
jgi:hypothetical protein